MSRSFWISTEEGLPEAGHDVLATDGLICWIANHSREEGWKRTHTHDSEQLVAWSLVKWWTPLPPLPERDNWHCEER